MRSSVIFVRLSAAVTAQGRPPARGVAMPALNWYSSTLRALQGTPRVLTPGGRGALNWYSSTLRALQGTPRVLTPGGRGAGKRSGRAGERARDDVFLYGHGKGCPRAHPGVLGVLQRTQRVLCEHSRVLTGVLFRGLLRARERAPGWTASRGSTWRTLRYSTGHSGVLTSTYLLAWGTRGGTHAGIFGYPMCSLGTLWVLFGYSAGTP